MTPLEQAIYKIPKGTLFSNKALLPHASYENARQVLSRLVKAGKLTRVTRGIYVRPNESPFLGEVLPEPSLVIKKLAEQTGETIVENGLNAANMLELTTQVPMKIQFLTSGTSRDVKIGQTLISLKHVSPRKVFEGEHKVGLALSALWYLGKENVTAQTVGKIKLKLSPHEFQALCQETYRMPTWMAKRFYLHVEGQ